MLCHKALRALLFSKGWGISAFCAGMPEETNGVSMERKLWTYIPAIIEHHWFRSCTVHVDPDQQLIDYPA
jgi:hypothetical protein